MAAKKETAMELVEETPSKKEHKLPAIGDIVYFYKPVQTAQGVDTKQFAALVLDYPGAGSNYQKKDMPLVLKIFTSAKGGADEVREAIHSETKTPLRWSFKA